MAASEEVAWDANLQSEDIIREVKKRPILYNKSLREYNNKLLKNKIWEDIVKNVSSDWDELSDLVRTLRCRDIQTKWKHIRDNFRRDYQINKEKFKNGKKKKKYRYYDQLTFLAPHIIEGNTCKDTNKRRVENGDLMQEYSVPSKRRHSPEKNFEVEVLEALSKRSVEPDDDDDRSFCLSLVKSMKKIDEVNKLTARMEILNVIRKFSFPEQHYNSQQWQECPCTSQAKIIKTSENKETLSIQTGHEASLNVITVNPLPCITVKQTETYDLSEEIMLPVEINEVKLEVDDD